MDNGQDSDTPPVGGDNSALLPLPTPLVADAQPIPGTSDEINLGHNRDCCIYCSRDDFVDPSEDGQPMPRTLVYCSSCSNACTHVECHQQHVGDQDSEFAQKTGLWFCSKVS